jgi:ATP-dependent DNA helicase RecQ
MNTAAALSMLHKRRRSVALPRSAAAHERRSRSRVDAVVRKVFGLSTLRPGQQAVIEAVLAGQHTLAIMPTGAGKSLCYQVPAMLMPGMTLVVSPLIALMRDQSEKLSALGLDAVQVNSAVPAVESTRAVPLIVATNAFGLGIDKSDIRTVIHYDLPASLDVYYQESGRAGRDGEPADCVLLFQRSDSSLQRFFMAGRYPSANEFAALVEGLRLANVAGTVSMLEIRGVAPRIAASKLRVMLAALKQAGLIVERRRSRYELQPAFLTASIESLAAAYDERRQRDQARLEQMVIYAQTALCRTRVLLEALGEVVEWSRCETCDNCRGVSIRPEGAAAGAA